MLKRFFSNDFRHTLFMLLLICSYRLLRWRFHGGFIFYSVLAKPTSRIERIITAIPLMMVMYVFLLTPFHSFKMTHHAVAMRIITAMCSIHDLAPFPSRLSPIP